MWFSFLKSLILFTVQLISWLIYANEILVIKVDGYTQYLLHRSKIANQEFSIWFIKTQASRDLVFDILKYSSYFFENLHYYSLLTLKFEKEEHDDFEFRWSILSSSIIIS